MNPHVNTKVEAMAMKKYPSVEAYLADFPPHIQEKLEQLRTMVKTAVPAAEEGVSYGMPVYILHYKLVWFGAYKKHISFYPEPAAMEGFEQELAPYETGKGTIKLSFDGDLPLALLSKIVNRKAELNVARAITEGKI